MAFKINSSELLTCSDKEKVACYPFLDVFAYLTSCLTSRAVLHMKTQTANEPDVPCVTALAGICLVWYAEGPGRLGFVLLRKGLLLLPWSLLLVGL